MPDRLAVLARLALLDPDQVMADAVREQIRAAASYNLDVEEVLTGGE